MNNTKNDNLHAPSAATADAPATRHWLIPKRWVALFALLCLLPWLVLGWLVGPLIKGGSSRVLPISSGADQPGQMGPWGRLSFEPMVLAPPLANLIDLVEPVVDPWRFPGMDMVDVRSYLTRVETPIGLVQELMSVARADPSIAGTTIIPTPAMIESLPAAARGRIYPFLSRFPMNFVSRSLNCFPISSASAWLSGASLPQPVVERVRRMFYTSDRFVWFGDLPLALSDISDQSTRAELAQTISRQFTWMVKLHIEPGQDIGPLVRYWGRGGREKQIAPLLESLSKQPSPQVLGIQNLLPPFARERLYTYSDPSLDKRNKGYDCHWTAFNFFNAQPDPNPTSPELFLKTIREQYQPIFSDLQMGDLMVYINSDQSGGGDDYLHSAVYIAGDLVFTKNSAGPTRPWMFMRMDDMKDFYSNGRNVEVRYFRRKM